MAQAAPRSLKLLFFAFSVSLGALSLGCGTDAKGIDSCREIEEERCRQAPACPAQFRVSSEEEVKACVRYYRDQCLHGLTGAEPGKPALDACLQTLKRAGSCAKSGVTKLDECSAAPSTQTSLTSPCEILVQPEKTAECAFLVPPAEPPPSNEPADAGAEDGSAEIVEAG